MNNIVHIANNNVIFTKWSRKNYAIFSSLKKVVKIARLSVDLCVSSLLKQRPLIWLSEIGKEFNILNHNDELWEEHIVAGNQLVTLLEKVAIPEIDKTNYTNNRSYSVNNKSPLLPYAINGLF